MLRVYCGKCDLVASSAYKMNIMGKSSRGGSEEGFMEEVGSEELFSVGIHAFLLRDSSRRETVLMH